MKLFVEYFLEITQDSRLIFVYNSADEHNNAILEMTLHVCPPINLIKNVLVNPLLYDMLYKRIVEDEFYKSNFN